MTKVVALCVCGCGRVNYARGLSKPCYYKKHGTKGKTHAQAKDTMANLVRGLPRGWGSL